MEASQNNTEGQLRHSRLHEQGCNTDLELFVEAIMHLDKVLNWCKTAQEQMEADKAARDFLELHKGD